MLSELAFIFFLALALSQKLTSMKVTKIVKADYICMLSIMNTQEILDLRTDCSSNIVTPTYNSWVGLISPNTAYTYAQGKGYRYFKNPAHYKRQSYNYSNYHNLLNKLLEPLGIRQLVFEDVYSLKMGYEQREDKWIVLQIDINYSYHPIDVIANISGYLVEREDKAKPNQNSFAVRKLTGKGLHQSINLTLNLDFETELQIHPASCNVVIEEVLPESTYIDADELRTVTQFQQINIEKPEHVAQQYFYRYSIPFQKFQEQSSRKYAYLYSLHFRYPQPSQLNYTVVPLHPSDLIQISCFNGTKITTIEEDAFSSRGVAHIFNGSSHDSRVVSMVTFILMIIASMVIIKQLRKE